MTDPLSIPSRFCGPRDTGNGGYVCGRIAAYLDDPVTVTLRRPAPLATPLAVERGAESSVRVYHRGTLIAEAASAPGSGEPDISGKVTLADACAVAGRARYYTDPAFPDCFVCGMGRRPGDGLRIFPGPLPGLPLWAAPWMPDRSVTDASGTVRAEMVWAALDCPSGIAAAEAADLAQDTAVLLGRMTATLQVLPTVGERYLVIAWPGERSGRKLQAESALLGPRGEVLAAAATTWLTVPRPVPALTADRSS